MLPQSRPCAYRACRRPGGLAAAAPPPFGTRETAASRRTRRRAAAASPVDADAVAGAPNDDLPASWAAAARRAHVAVVLVEPQICENIGAAARVMRNFGIRPPPEDGNDGADGGPHLRLVRPRDGCPPPQLSFDVACGGADLVATAGCYDSLQQALADRQVVYAATARARRQAPQSLNSRQLARDFARRCRQAEETSSSYSIIDPCRVALVFGRESSGLTNEEVGRAHAVVEVDACADYPVLNLGQAVGALVYELWTVRRPLLTTSGTETEEGSDSSHSNFPANRAAEAAQVDGFLARLYASLERGGFFVEQNKRPSVERSLAGLLRRVEGLGERDLALLHGALTALAPSSQERRR